MQDSPAPPQAAAAQVRITDAKDPANVEGGRWCDESLVRPARRDTLPGRRGVPVHAARQDLVVLSWGLIVMASIAQLVQAEPVQLGTLLSICSAIALAVVGFVRTRLEDRRRYTLGVLMGYSQSTELLRALHRVREQAARRKANDRQVDDAVAEHLAIILPHFQSIALAAKSGLLDREIILSARYSTMKSIWEAYGAYVRTRRSELNRPLLYIELEEFLDSNAARYAAYAQQYAGRYAGGLATASARDALG